MNIIDIVILGILALFLLNGIYRGFLPSIMNLAGLFISWIVSFLAYPAVSRKFCGSELFSSLRFYIEGAEKVGDFEIAKQAVTNFSPMELEEIVQTALSEAQIESLIIAKGYADCVAYMSREGISVAVSSPEGGLQQEDVAVIADIVITQTGFAMEDIRVVEVP